MSAYPYCNGPLLNLPQSYMYTPYLGLGFIFDWHKSRSSYLTQCRSPVYLELPSNSIHLNDPDTSQYSTEDILVQLCLDLRTEAKMSKHVVYWLPRMLKKFEVSKRLYQFYGIEAPHRIVSESSYEKLELYLLLAESLIRAWAIKPISQYINGLLKLVDTLLSQKSQLNRSQSSHLEWLIIAEQMILDTVLKQSDLKKDNAHSIVRFKCDSHSFLDFTQPLNKNSNQTLVVDGTYDGGIVLEKSKKTLLLCGHTTRSIAYIQALCSANIIPCQIIVYGTSKSKFTSTRTHSNVSIQNMFTPNLELDILQSLDNYGLKYTSTEEQELSAPALLALIKEADPDLIIYSGYGGQLVPASILSEFPVLHIHSGWLPDYRGSTTLYYQILDENCCAASAILLDEQIDTGVIVARKRYPIPENGIDVDHLYDSTIRADLLVETLKQWLDPFKQWNKTTQTEDSLPFFIIHPLLKHLALLKIDQEIIDL
ncbi:formyltransferase family protein [Paraglaciecola sp. 20A4]|uniref:formyltransferase family protein n=1 Tax=Paraglaciecola sp. 20A4 TaxID=2687288 RepID=UPI00197FFC01